ncbi:PepSY domain-containing protein [Reyranella sp.]|uniref:PepSY-associated TM helix domain-containing protein n=1 Tax=Reyranella sp. TaxID=1929291 RepID=UPI0012293F99|nr:PepSY-associated TM helix domain-containing protein [Reyranella sp.]TAJ90863.1 MAG: PepSY domain-containing protein [Reyranella sp.]
METGFRASMNWLHTWAGVVLGGLLFAIFWMGTLSVFDREIDRWMAPMTRLPVTDKAFSLESLRPSYEAAAAAKAPSWLVTLPTERDPVLQAIWREASGFVVRLIDPATGAALPDPGTWGGTRFLYPFHYMLHIKLGYWIVGVAAMAMLALCVSGVVIHRKIFVDFFTFRAGRQPRRLVLDLHNVTGVLGLPFHFVISLSGLIIFYSVYFPGTIQIAYDDEPRAFAREAYGHYERPKLGKPGELASLDAMATEALRRWDGAAPRYLFARNPGDAASSLQIARLGEGRVSGSNDVVYFDTATGALLHQRSEPQPVLTVQRFISGLHLIQFRHWTLRWVYFGLGLTGCVLIATGYLFWLESRRKRHAQLGLHGVPIVEGLTIGSVTGIVIATLAFFVVNRLLPLGVTFLGEDRAALEIWTFYLVWLATFAHAWLRPGLAWVEHCWAITIFALSAVLLNWITTGDHPLRSLSYRHLWPIAGMDLLLLVGAAIAALTAWTLQHRAAKPHAARHSLRLRRRPS